MNREERFRHLAWKGGFDADELLEKMPEKTRAGVEEPLGERAVGDLWLDVGGVDERLKVWHDGAWKRLSDGARKLSDKTLEMAAAAEASGYEFTRLALRPHDVRLRGGYWECGRCGAASADPDLIRDIGCDD